MSATKPCPECGGTGIDGSHAVAVEFALGGEMPDCGGCGGSGRVVSDRPPTPEHPMPDEPAEDCGAHPGLTCDEVDELRRVDRLADDELLNELADDGFWVNVNNAYDYEGGMRLWQVSIARVDGDGYNEPSIEHDRIEADGPTLTAAISALRAAVVAYRATQTPEETT